MTDRSVSMLATPCRLLSTGEIGEPGILDCHCSSARNACMSVVSYDYPDRGRPIRQRQLASYSSTIFRRYRHQVPANTHGSVKFPLDHVRCTTQILHPELNSWECV